MKKRILLPAIALTAFLVGCSGVKQDQINEVAGRLDELTKTGLPDSVLIEARDAVFKINAAKSDGDNEAVKTNYELALAELAKADSILAQSIQDRKPVIAERLSNLETSSDEQLKGLHRLAIDSLLTEASDLLEKNWVIDAEALVNEGDSLFESLKEQQVEAEKLRPRLVGTWKFRNVLSNSMDPEVNAVAEKTFVLRRNGTASFINTKKGKSGPKLKEDWKFESYGTWEMKGDTIHILTDRFVCPRQNLWELKVVDEKEQWVLNEQPTFDDSVTDGSQDRHISYSNLIEDFRK